MKKISFIDGSESEKLLNDHKRKRTTVPSNDVSMELKYVGVNQLNYILDKQPDTNIKENSSLDDFTNSVINYGSIVPIIVYPNNEDVDDKNTTYTVIDGERRLEATIRSNRHDLMALVLYNVTPQTAIVMRMVLRENVYRSPIKLLNDAKELRNITDTYDDSTQELEKMFNLDPGDFSKIQELIRRCNNNKYSDSKKDIDRIYNDYTNAKITITDALAQIDLSDKKQAKAQMKKDKEIEDYEESEGYEDDNSVSSSSKKGNNDDEPNGGTQDDLEDKFRKIDEQNSQQYVGERQILNSSIAKQLSARDDSMCVICGYGGNQNPSVASQLEKHHIIDVQYGGKDNVDNIVELCPNDHKLITNFLSGKSNEYNPTEDDLNDNPNNWGSVILGNMGRVAKKNALRQVKAKSQDTYDKVIRKNLTVGQAIKILKLDIVMPREFKRNPYQTFKQHLFELKRDVPGFVLHNHNLSEEYEKVATIASDNKEKIDDSMINLQKDDIDNIKTVNTLANEKDDSLSSDITINLNDDQKDFIERSKK